MNKECNVRLITIDSCRYDTAIKAITPTLNSISSLMMAETDATYTYPSHHSMFIGILPRRLGEVQQYIPEYDQLWRSGGARYSEKRVFESYSESNIVQHYQAIGYNVQGFGGVQFFNPELGCNTLPKLFDSFTYFGPKTYIPEHEVLPRKSDSFPLGHIDQIASSLKGNRPYFLFMNCPETHNSYDTPGTNADEYYRALIKRLNHEHSTKIVHPVDKLPFSGDEINLLKGEQVRALEWIDSQLALLLAEIPNEHPTLTIVVGDHGDEFGEEGRFGHAHNAATVRTVPLWASYIE